ncbi:MAG: hypothetical protein IJQ34_00750 [Kiritimatiellae bacterium]|nr:hypothetical protein [Kiritimatiellia bacterium]
MKTILNSIEELNGDTLAVVVAPLGKYPCFLRSADGKKKPIVQTIDSAALERVLNAWESGGAKELLVDADHDSMHGGSTRAYAWAGNLRRAENGLVCDFKFTPLGRETVTNREFRFVSPVFNCDKSGKILSLENIALTNRPNLPVPCLINSEEAAEEIVDQPNEENPQMDKIKEALGLGADATEEAVVEAIAALQKRISDAEAATVKNEAERCADENKDRLENRDEFIKLYCENGKEVAMAFLSAIKAPAKPAEKPAQVLLNAKDGATPVIENAREQMATLPPSQRAAFFKEHEKEFN